MNSSTTGFISRKICHLNILYLNRYGVIIGSLQVYIIVQNVWKFVRFAEMPWPSMMTPTIEMNVFIGLNGKHKVFNYVKS